MEAPTIDLASADVSMEDLRAAYDSATSVIEVEDETPATDPAKPVVGKTTESESGTDDTEQNSEETEVELPKGVLRRIAVETAKQARIQAEIDRHVSTTKAKEAELAKLAGKPGADPVKTPEPEKNARPVRPEPNFDEVTDLDSLEAAKAKHRADLAKYETDLEAWFKADTEKTFEQRYSAKEAEKSKARWMEEGTAKHGADFPSLVVALEASLPEPLQMAVSVMEDAAAMVAHLGKNPDALKSLIDKFNANPYAGIAELGKLEAKLEPDSKQADKKVTAKPLPKPLMPVGGGASASSVAVDLEKADDATVLAEIGRMAKAARAK